METTNPKYTVGNLFQTWAENPDKILDTVVQVNGWIEFKRDSGEKFFFISLRDGTDFKTLQCVCDSAKFSNQTDFEILKDANRGSSIGLEGTIVNSPAPEQPFELVVSKAEIYGTVDDDYPLQKARLPLEHLRNYPHLRIRTKTHMAVQTIRNTCQLETHLFYNGLGFTHIATPIITANDCEGAGETFDISNKLGDQPFFGKPVHLTVSGQLHVEPFAHAFSRVYTFGPTFRAENSNTSRHLAEFWMIEPELSFISFTELLDNMEAYLKHICRAVLGKHGNILSFLATFYSLSLITNLERIVEEPFNRITYSDALKMLERHIREKKIIIKRDREATIREDGKMILPKAPVFGDDFGSVIEKYLVAQMGDKPLFITHFPTILKSFYMRRDITNSDLMEATDLLVPGVGELMGGSMREHNLQKLREVMEAKGVPAEGLEFYTDLRRFGTVPHGGYGVGFERLVAFVCGIGSIRDVIPFPRAPGVCMG